MLELFRSVRGMSCWKGGIGMPYEAVSEGGLLGESHLDQVWR